MKPLVLPLKLLMVAAVLTGCSVGPDFKIPEITAPNSWSDLHSGDVSLQNTLTTAISNPIWWEAYHDDLLNKLIENALINSPDLLSAALNFAASKAAAGQIDAAKWPELSLSGKMSREKMSKAGSTSRMVNSVYDHPDKLLNIVGHPYSWYQAGVNFSWELDLWGDVRRQVEASDANIRREESLLAQAQLSIVADLVNQYFTLRNIQQDIQLTEEDVASVQERLNIITVQNVHGKLDETVKERQNIELASIKSKLIDLRKQEGQAINQLLLLLGEQGWQQALTAKLLPLDQLPPLPELTAGLPAEVARNRPDIQAAEAKLHAATARIGIATAALYPNITLGGRFGYDTYQSNKFGEWGSRTWSIGPSLDLPLFDYGKRKSVVTLRKIEQQQAAVDFHKTVLKAWQEIDDALSRYTAARQKWQEQTVRAQSAASAWSLIKARFDGGMISFIDVLDSQRNYIQSRTALADSKYEVLQAYAAVNRALGNMPIASTE
ncbi:efflux transporter outer membrane subunit [Orbaceae bacterium ESL0721]|nr:efflux transporter outer membrane subunit [Orbaceae bacterium ESL0721]